MMQIPFSFDAMLLFGIMSIMLLIGIFLRAKISFFQNFLIPGCLIGGILGLILVHSGLFRVSAGDLETLAYHFFNISFISVGLTPGSHLRRQNRIGNKEFLRGPLWMALSQTFCFALQAVVGGAIVMVFGLIGLKLFPTFGFLSPLGFEEGPGQALSIGKVWETAGFQYAATIGLTFAAVGYFFAFFIGVPLVNWGVRKGMARYGTEKLPQDLLTGLLAKNQQPESAGFLRMHSANADTLAFQAALVGLVYILTYGLIRMMGTFFAPDVAAMLWGFFFFGGLMIALAVRFLMGRLGIDYLVDPGIQRRITGWSIDFLIVCTVMAVQLQVVWQYFWPVTAIALTSGVSTTAAVIFLGKRIWSYNLERLVAVYGTVTGTVSCGLLLLRIVDPDFSTPVAIEIGIVSALMLIPLPGMLVLVNANVWWGWSIPMIVGCFLAIMILSLIAIRAFGMWEKPRF